MTWRERGLMNSTKFPSDLQRVQTSSNSLTNRYVRRRSRVVVREKGSSKTCLYEFGTKISHNRLNLCNLRCFETQQQKCLKSCKRAQVFSGDLEGTSTRARPNYTGRRAIFRAKAQIHSQAQGVDSIRQSHTPEGQLVPLQEHLCPRRRLPW